MHRCQHALLHDEKKSPGSDAGRVEQIPVVVEDLPHQRIVVGERVERVSHRQSKKPVELHEQALLRSHLHMSAMRIVYHNCLRFTEKFAAEFEAFRNVLYTTGSTDVWSHDFSSKLALSVHPDLPTLRIILT